MTKEPLDSLPKHSISGPYNFHHLTHTEPLQAKALQSVSPRDLVSEFSAIRASQTPQRELKGIRAENIYLVASPESQFFDSPTTARGSPVASRSGSACGSPTTVDYPHSLSTSKSVDSFTRLASKSFSSPKPPYSPPPRRSSRKPLSLSKVLVINTNPPAQESPTIPDFAPPSGQGSPPPSFQHPLYSPTALFGKSVEQSDIAQAVTTPDDTACMLVTRQLSSPQISLEDVPEEEEALASKQSTNGDYFNNTLRHARSFPSPKRFARQFDGLPSLPASIEDGQGLPSDPILPLNDPQSEDIPEVSRRVSVLSRSLHDSWEDDIDYCYEHAMEADCDPNWTALAEQEDQWIANRNCGLQIQTTFENTSPKETTSGQEKPYFDVPRLEAEGSTASSAVTASSIATPSDTFPPPNVLTVPRDPSGSVLFPLSPSLLIPKEYNSRLTHEESYSHKLPVVDPKESFAFHGNSVDAGTGQEYSPRSSAAPSSKDITSDSYSTSRPASITTGSSSQYRKSSSVGSIPELVYSRRQDATIDKLVQQITNTTLSQVSTDSGPEEDAEGQGPPVPAKSGQQQSVDKELPPLPLKVPLRARSSSDSASQLLDMAMMTMPPRLGSSGEPGGRTRSTSVVAAPSAGRPRGHRTSYSLFPSITPVR